MKTSFTGRRHTGRRGGFTLVEIVLALGVVSFSLLAIIGTLPVGFESMQESMMHAAQANISRELRGEFQQISFKSEDGSGVPPAIAKLTGTTYFYSQEGMVLTGSANAYYAAKFDVGAGSASSYEFKQDNVNNITVTLSYPLVAPEANRKKAVFTLFAAKQKSN